MNRLQIWAVALAAACQGGATTALADRVFRDPSVAALAVAAAEGDSARVRQLIAEGANPNAHGDKGVTLPQWALLHKSRKGLEALVLGGADPAAADSAGETVVHYAAKANDPQYLETLLALHADANTPNGVTRATPIVDALMANRDVQFHALLAAGADPEAADRMGDTPLHQAAKINAHARVLELLEAGADPRTRNNVGSTFQRYFFMTPESVMHEEARAGRRAVEAWLRAHGVAVDPKDGR